VQARVGLWRHEPLPLRPSWTQQVAPRRSEPLARSRAPIEGATPVSLSRARIDGSERGTTAQMGGRPHQNDAEGYGVGGFSGLVPPAHVPCPASPGEPCV
jgi:hypothetical protein